jgi:hypothetical protein
MKKRLLLITALALMLTTVLVGTAAAQGGCFGDVVNYLACFVDNDDLEILRINSEGNGVLIGEIPVEIYGYAAANYEGNQFVNRLVSPEDGSYIELYFTGKQMVSANTYETTWSFVVYDANGTALSIGEYAREAAPTPGVMVPFASAPAAAPAAPAASSDSATTTTTTTTGSMDAPYSGAYEPVIVQAGTVENCLVRNTYTVRMREAPTTQAPILDKVPYDTSMPADLITSDGLWVRAFFVGEGGEGRLGWISERYLALSEACEGLSVAAPVGGAVTVSVPAAPAAPAADDDDDTADAPTQSYDPTFNGVIDLTVVEPGDVENCLVRTTYTVRMRAAPSTNAPMLDNIPYRTSMPADLRTVDGEWVRANYLGALGWIDSTYLSQSEACEGLNGISPIQ